MSSTFDSLYEKWKNGNSSSNGTTLDQGKKADTDRIDALYEQWRRNDFESNREAYEQSLNERLSALQESRKNFTRSYTDRYSNRDVSAYVSDSQEWLDSVSGEKQAYEAGMREFLKDLSRYEDFYDQDWVKNMKNTLADEQRNYLQVYNAAKAERDYYTQFESEEAYNEYRDYEGKRSFDLVAGKEEIANLEAERERYIAESDMDWTDYQSRKAYEEGLAAIDAQIEEKKDYWEQAKEVQDEIDEAAARQKDYEEKSKFDLDAGQEEIDYLERLLEEYKIRTRTEGDEESERRIQEIRSQYGYTNDLEALISQKKAYLNQAKYIQNGIMLSSVAENADFDEYSGYASTKSDKWYSALTSEYGMGYDDLAYEYINNQGNIRAEIDGMRRAYDNAGEESFEAKGYNYMTEDEVAIYNYHYAKSGKEAAEKYLDSIQETLNYRKAQERYESYLKDNTMRELVFGAEAGLDQFKSGMKGVWQATIGKDDYIPVSSTQMLSGMVREDLADDSIPLWYNFKEGKWENKVFGNSLAQVGYDTVTTTSNMLPSILASTAVNAVAPGAGSVVGSALLGASASGNAYQEMLNLGYDKNQARGYAALVGASEAGLEYLLGGISSLGGKLSGNTVQRMLNGVDNAFARTAIKLGGNMFSEGFEEGLQEILTPMFQNLVLYAGEDVNWSEVVYSYLLGALTAGMMEGGSTVSGEVSTYKTGKELQKAGVSAQSLAQLGSTLPADTVAYQLAGRVDENTGAYTLGRLFNEIGAEVTAHNKADIRANLERRGIRGKDAKVLTEAFAAVAEGSALTDQQIAYMEKNDILTQAILEELIGNPKSTTAQRTQAYLDIVKSAQAAKTKKAAAAEQSAAGAENTEITEKSMPRQPKSAESQQEPRAVTIHEVAKQYGKYAGTVENAYQEGQDLGRFETAFRAVYDMAKEGVSQDYAMKSAQGLGLTETQKEIAYGMGKFNNQQAMERRVSDSGETTIVSTGEAAQVEEIAEVKNGEIRLKMGNGKTVASSDVAYSSIEQAQLVETIGKADNMTAVAANQLIRGYEGGMSAESYANGVTQAYRYGFYGYPMSDMAKSHTDAAKLTEAQRARAYKLGREARTGDSQQKQTERQKTKKADTRQGTVYFDKGANQITELRSYLKENGQKLKDTQETAVLTMEKLSAALGMDFYVFESYEKGGQRVYVNENGVEAKAPNGYYDASTRRIYIDLNAGVNGDGLMLYTVSHELTHYIRQWSPAKFQTLADFLFGQYGKQRQSVAELVEQKRAKAKERGMPIDYDTAYEEVVADSMETMLQSGNVVQMMADLKQQDQTLWQKICDWFKNLAEDLKAVVEAYKGYKPESPEGRMVTQMRENITILESLYADALVDASQNAAGAEKNTADGGGVKYSIKNTSTMTLEQQLKLYYAGKLKSSDSLYFGTTPTTIRESGMDELPLAFLTSDFKKSTQEKHNVPRRAIKALRANLNKALFSFGIDNKIGFVVPDIDRDGKPLLIGIEKDVKMDNRLVNAIRSAYGLDNPKKWLGNQISAGKSFVVYDEKGANSFLHPYGYSASREEGIKLLNETVPQQQPEVNKNFSQRDPEAVEVNRAMEKENARLKEDVAELKEMLKLQRTVTGGTKFTKSSVDAAASVLMKSADAKGNRAELTQMLNGLYEYIAQGEELTWEGVTEKAAPAVEWLQKNKVKRPNDYAEGILKEISGRHVRLDEQQKQEAAYRFGSYDSFRKSMMGRLVVSDKADTSLDSLWNELAAAYPSVFDPDTSSADLPGAMLDAITMLKNMPDMEQSLYSPEMEAQDLLRQVYDSYWRVSTLYTQADRHQKQLNELKGKHYQRMQDLKQAHRENVDKLNREHRERVQRIRQEYRQSNAQKQAEIRKQYQEARQKGIDSRKRTEMRHKVQRVVKELNELLLKGTKDRHVPIELQKAVAEALEAVNMDTVNAEARIAKLEEEMLKAKTPEKKQEIAQRMANVQGMGDRMQDKLQSLKNAYDRFVNSDDPLVANSYDEVISAKMESVIQTVGDTPLREMSVGQLEEVYDMYRMVLTTVRNANKAFKAAKAETITELSGRVMEEVERVGGKKGLQLKSAQKIDEFLWNNAKPVYAFERIGSETFTEVFQKVRDGEDAWAVDMTEARKFYTDTAKQYGYQKWDMEKRWKFTSASGMEFELNLPQIMSLYAYSKREQAADHLRKGGIVIDETTEVTVKSKLGIPMKFNPTEATAYNITDETLAEIVGKLSGEQKAFVDQMQAYLSDTMGGKGNEVSLQMYGIKLFNEKNYFPLKSATQYMAKAKEQADGNVKLKNAGFSKETVKKASNPIVLTPFMDVWAGHVNEMSMYHAFVLPMEDFYRVYNYKTAATEDGAIESVEGKIQNAYGKAATKYIDQLLKDLNGGAITDPRESTAKVLMGKFKKAAVFSSASVVIQQPSAIARAFALVDPKYFIGAKVDSKRHKALWAELKRYAPVAAIKEMGYFDTGMGKSAQDFIKGKEYNTLKEKAAALFTDGDYRDEVLSKAPALADELTWCTIWEAAKRETKAKNPGLSVSSEEFLTAAGKRFTEVITKTQVYDSVLSRSANMRSKSAFMNMLTAFMAEPTTSINMLEDALRKGKREDKRYAARAIGAVFTSVVLNSLLVSFVYAARDDDEDETFWEKYAQSFASEMLDGINPITYYPFLKDIWSALQGFDIERADMSLITSLTESVTRIVQLAAKDTGDMSVEQLAAHEEKVHEAMWGIVDGICSLAGLPVKNVRRDINGAINMVRTIGTDLLGDRDTSWGSLVDKTWDDVKNSLPVIGWLSDETAADKLYGATVNGDTTYQARLESAYDTQSALNSAIRKGLRANDPRIWEAAIAWNNDDLEEYMRIAEEIIGEKHFSQDNVVMAIQAEAKAMADTQSDSGSSTSTARGYFTAEKFAVAVAQDNDDMADTIKADIIETAQKNGKTAEEAEKSFASSARSACKEMFLAGNISEAKTIDALVSYCGESREDAEKRVGEWAFEEKYGFAYADRADAYQSGAINASELKTVLMDVGGKSAEEAEIQIQVYDWQSEVPGCDSITSTAIQDYNENCESVGISREDYYNAWVAYNGTDADYDADGNSVPYSKVQKVMPYIDSLDLTAAQKTALAECWWAEGTVQKYKLW